MVILLGKSWKDEAIGGVERSKSIYYWIEVSSELGWKVAGQNERLFFLLMSMVYETYISPFKKRRKKNFSYKKLCEVSVCKHEWFEKWM